MTFDLIKICHSNPILNYRYKFQRLKNLCSCCLHKKAKLGLVLLNFLKQNMQYLYHYCSYPIDYNCSSVL